MFKFLKRLINGPERPPLPPSDLEGITFLRRGKDGRLWAYTLDKENAQLWDECLRRNIRSSKGWNELDWRRDELKDGDGGITTSLPKLQAFVRDIASNYDCDSDAHRHNNGGCRACNAKKLFVI